MTYDPTAGRLAYRDRGRLAEIRDAHRHCLDGNGRCYQTGEPGCDVTDVFVELDRVRVLADGRADEIVSLADRLHEATGGSS